MSRESVIGRREFLGGVVATGAAAIVGPSLLAACATASTSNTTTATESVKLPTYVKYPGVKPDLAGNNQGLLDAFLKYPQPAKKVFDGVQGPGGTVSAFVLTGSPVPPAVDQNPFWQELNKRLGTDLKLTITPSADMATKFSTLIACLFRSPLTRRASAAKPVRTAKMYAVSFASTSSRKLNW